MPKSSTLRVPSYRRHKPTNQAVVTINGQDIYLGKWNTAVCRPSDFHQPFGESLFETGVGDTTGRLDPR